MNKKNKFTFRDLINHFYNGGNISSFSKLHKCKRDTVYNKLSKLQLKHLRKIEDKVKKSRVKIKSKKTLFQSFIYKYKNILEKEKIQPLGVFQDRYKYHNWRTPYGLIKIKPYILEKNNFKVNISFYEDKKLYLKNKIKKLNPTLSKKIINYLHIENNKYLIGETKYGIFKQEIKNIYTKNDISVKSYLDKTSYYYKRIKEVQPELELIKIDNRHAIIKNKYGLTKNIVTHILKGNSPTIRTALNKDSYLKNQFRDVHGDTYDYSKFIYRSNSIKSTIICKKHGEFKQNPNSHLNGSCCPQCAALRNTFYCIKNLNKKTSKCNNKKSGFYIIEIYNEEEIFTKAGITNNFKRRKKEIEKSMNLKYKIKDIYYEKCNLEQAIKTEDWFLNKNKCVFKYLPLNKFSGYTECFVTTKNLLEIGKEKALSENFINRLYNYEI